MSGVAAAWLVAVCAMIVGGGRVAGAAPCSLLVGYSQTEALVQKGGLGSRFTSPGSWRYMVNPNGQGGNLKQWADASFYPYANGWNSWGSSCDPTRIVLQATWDSYTTDVDAVAAMIPQAVALIRARWAPHASVVSVIGAVGGPGLCAWGGANYQVPASNAQPYVRSSYNAQVIRDAIGRAGVVAGPVLAVSDCAHFQDWVGHWLVDGWNDVYGESGRLAAIVAAFYNAVDSGASPSPTAAPSTAAPSPTSTPGASCGP